MSTLASTTADTLAATRDAIAKATGSSTGLNNELPVGQGTILEDILQTLYPVESPIANETPRIVVSGRKETSWQAITSVKPGGSPFVGEKDRAPRLKYTSLERFAKFKTLGAENDISDEYEWDTKGFVDARAQGVTDLEAVAKIVEEDALLGGNHTALGAPTGVVAGVSDEDGTLDGGVGGASVFVGISALTHEGYVNEAAGTVDGEESRGETTVTVVEAEIDAGVDTASITLLWPWLRKAVAYNVYVGTAADELKFVKTVFVPTVTITELPADGNAPNATDLTGNVNAFDGLIPQIEAADSNAVFVDMAGASLTATSTGQIKEIDDVLRQLWKQAKVTPERIWVSAEQSEDILALLGTLGEASAVRLTATISGQTLNGGLSLGTYRNQFAKSGTKDINIEIHPKLAPGTMLFMTYSVSYALPEGKNLFEVEASAPWHLDEFARTVRAYEFGVYTREAFKVRFPASLGAIVGVGRNAG